MTVTPVEWISGFTTYSLVVIAKEPSRASELFSYLNIVMKLAKEVQGTVGAYYDGVFFQAASNNKSLKWDNRDPDIYLDSIAAPGAKSRVGGSGTCVLSATSLIRVATALLLTGRLQSQQVANGTQ